MFETLVAQHPRSLPLTWFNQVRMKTRLLRPD
jgi:hypothetical protein